MTGGTGFVGTLLAGKLAEQGHQLTILTRSTGNRNVLKGTSFVEGNPVTPGSWQEKVAGHDAIINLAGHSIFKRWTSATKKAIRDSRVLTTQNLVEALSAQGDRKTVLLSTSAVGYYGFRGDEELDETSPAGDDFLASVTQEWEASALEAEKHGIRVILCRFGIVLGSHGGALSQLIPLFKKALGSPLGGGTQWFSWIHEEDLAKIYLFLLEHKNLTGPINCTAPAPVRNRELTEILGKTLGKPTFMPAVPGFLIRIALGEFGSVLLNGQKALPKRLLELGFDFRFSNIEEALEDLLIHPGKEPR